MQNMLANYSMWKRTRSNRALKFIKHLFSSMIYHRQNEGGRMGGIVINGLVGDLYAGGSSKVFACAQVTGAVRVHRARNLQPDMVSGLKTLGR